MEHDDCNIVLTKWNADGTVIPEALFRLFGTSFHPIDLEL